MKVYNTELQRLQEEMMEEKRLEAKLAELRRQQEELTGKTDELRRIMKDEQEDVDRLLGEEPLLRRNYLRYLSGRIRFLSGRLGALAQTGAEGKLARYLLSSGEPSVHAPATDLAKRLGLSRASLYRAFEALESAGLIRREGKTVFVLDRGGLEGVL